MSAVRSQCPVCGITRLAAPSESERPCISCKRWAHVLLVPLGKWAAEAKCAEVDPELWFPVWDGKGSSTTAAAKRVCAQCPVRAECLAYALEVCEPHGVWGGLTPHERRQLKKKGTAA